MFRNLKKTKDIIKKTNVKQNFWTANLEHREGKFSHCCNTCPASQTAKNALQMPIRPRNTEDYQRA